MKEKIALTKKIRDSLKKIKFLFLFCHFIVLKLIYFLNPNLLHISFGSKQAMPKARGSFLLCSSYKIDFFDPIFNREM
jgi:hypothetical protein